TARAGPAPHRDRSGRSTPPLGPRGVAASEADREATPVPRGRLDAGAGVRRGAARSGARVGRPRDRAEPLHDPRAPIRRPRAGAPERRHAGRRRTLSPPWAAAQAAMAELAIDGLLLSGVAAQEAIGGHRRIEVFQSDPPGPAFVL